jgi:hypothetical protein
VSHRRIAVVVFISALIVDFWCGWGFAYAQDIPLWRGLYNALANAVTLGGDVAPSTPGGYITNAIECFTVIPLFAASLSFFTSGLAELHIRRSETRMRKHITEQCGTDTAPDRLQ